MLMAAKLPVAQRTLRKIGRGVGAQPIHSVKLASVAGQYYFTPANLNGRHDAGDDLLGTSNESELRGIGRAAPIE